MKRYLLLSLPLVLLFLTGCTMDVGFCNVKIYGKCYQSMQEFCTTMANPSPRNGAIRDYEVFKQCLSDYSGVLSLTKSTNGESN